jgi:hypothetical protein
MGYKCDVSMRDFLNLSNLLTSDKLSIQVRVKQWQAWVIKSSKLGMKHTQPLLVVVSAVCAAQPSQLGQDCNAQSLR